MLRRNRFVPLIVILGLSAACQASPTPVAPTLAAATQAPAATAVPTATTAPAATVAPTSTTAPTEAPTAVPSTATPAALTSGPAIQFPVGAPWGLALDASGTLYVSSCFIGPIVETGVFAVDTAGLIKVYAGHGVGWGGDDGPALQAHLWCPGGMAIGPDGSLYVADAGNNRVRRIDKQGVITTVAGSGEGSDINAFNTAVGSFAGDGGPATAAALWAPTDVVFDQQGNLYIADHNNNRVRKVDTQGIITTVAGTGTAGSSGDGGPATQAELHTQSDSGVSDQGNADGPENAMSLAIDAAGNLYIADSGNARVRKVSTNGIITTFAGTGVTGFSGDGGPARAAQLSAPGSMAFDAAGNLYFGDGPNASGDGNYLRKVDRKGIITTVAGSGRASFSGDGGPASAAELSNPSSIVFDAQGNLYFADKGNNRIRKIDAAGIITTVAGNGSDPS